MHMSKLASIRKEYAAIDAIARWQETLWYPALFAVLCAIAGSGDYRVYAPVFWIYCIFTVFSALFADDLKVFIPPVFFFYCSLGSDLTPLQLIRREGSFDSFSTAGLVNFLAAGAIMLVAFMVKLAVSGAFSRFFKKRSGIFYSIVAMSISLMLNGIFSSSASFKNLFYGICLGGGLLLLYLLFSAILDSSREPAPYICASALGVSLAASVQLFIRAAQMHSQGYLFSTVGGITAINRNVLQFSWGVATIVGAIIVIGIPAAFYLARQSRYSFLYYISAIVLVLASIIVDTRSAIITSIIFFIFCSIFCCFSGKNKTANRIYTVTSIVIGIGTLIAFHIYHGDLLELWNELLRFLRFDIISENLRLEYWKVGINDFLSAPVFGIGFDAGVVIEDTYQTFENAFTGMYHSVIIQFLASVGILGFAAFGYHCVEYARLMFKRRSGGKLLILLLPAMIIVMSLVDNFFFQFSFQIFYAAFLALAEKESCEK
jgi:uncharacterized membrane protein YccF (DUF307 family)